MRRLARLFAVASLFVLPVVSAGAAHADGLYEITTTMHIPGLPERPPQKHTQCINAKDPVPHAAKQDKKDCSIWEVKKDGDKVTWHVKCPSPRGDMEANGTIQYSGDGFTGKVEMKADIKGRPMQMTQTLEGHRTGDCTQ